MINTIGVHVYQWLPYFLFILFILFFFSFIVILGWARIKHPFWAIQPVAHYYDIQYWFQNKGIISTQLPDKNKYVNFQKIKTVIVTESNLDKLATMWSQVLGCIQTHYLREKTCEYVPTLSNIIPYFVGHAFPCFISTFTEPELLSLASPDIKLLNNDKIIGVMTSRPLYVTIFKGTVFKSTVFKGTMFKGTGFNGSATSIQFPVYYVDFLCVDKTRRKQNVAPQLIQTHEYVQSHQSHKISVSLFKREGELTGIVPLTVFDTECFAIENVLNTVPLKPNTCLLVKVTTTNIRILYNFLVEQQEIGSNNHDIFIIPHLANLTECIKTDNIIAYMCIHEDIVQSCYFFRMSQTFLNNKLVVSCFASLWNTDTRSTFNCSNRSTFIQGFQSAFTELITKEKHIGYLTVENIGNNAKFIHEISEVKPYLVSPTAYFFYNFAYSPFLNHRAFILC